MAAISKLEPPSDASVYSWTVFGRSHRADIYLNAKGASEAHALICWDGAQWLLRDLGSRNGTKINDLPLRNREWRLQVGDIITFGDPSERWRWTDGARPKPLALVGDAGAVHGEERLLLLPNAESPRASIYARDDHWEIDLGEAQRPIEDGEVLALGEEHFRLVLPRLQPSSNQTLDITELPSIASAKLTFRVSQDEEFVSVTVLTLTREHTLPERSFHYMLLTLARNRVRDDNSGIGGADAGWTYLDDMVEEMRSNPERINVDIHRARELFAGLRSFSDPQKIIERRRGQIRLGIGKITIDSPTRTLSSPVAVT